MPSTVAMAHSLCVSAARRFARLYPNGAADRGHSLATNGPAGSVHRFDPNGGREM